MYRAKALFAAVIFGPACFFGFVFAIAKAGFGWGGLRAESFMDKAADEHASRAAAATKQGEGQQQG